MKKNQKEPEEVIEECIISPEFVLRFPTWNYFQGIESDLGKTTVECLPAGDVFFFNISEGEKSPHITTYQLRVTTRAIPALISMLRECHDWLKSCAEDGPEYEKWKARWDLRNKTKPLPKGIERIKLDEEHD